MKNRFILFVMTITIAIAIACSLNEVSFAAEIEKVKIEMLEGLNDLPKERYYYYKPNYNRNGIIYYEIIKIGSIKWYSLNMEKLYFYLFHSMHYLDFLKYKLNNTFGMYFGFFDLETKIKGESFLSFLKEVHKTEPSILVKDSFFLENVRDISFLHHVDKPSLVNFIDDRNKYIGNLIEKSRVGQDVFGSLVYLEENRVSEGIFLMVNVFLIKVITFIFYYIFMLAFFVYIYFYFFIWILNMKMYASMYEQEFFLVDDGEEGLSYIEVKLLLDEFDRFNKYYNIIKLESFLLNFIVDKKNVLWILKTEEEYNSSKCYPVFSLKYSLFNLSVTRIEVRFWTFFGLSEFDDRYLIPYDMFNVAFPEYPNYFNYFDKMHVEVPDKGYDGIDEHLYDEFGFIEHRFVEHPLSEFESDSYMDEEDLFGFSIVKGQWSAKAFFKEYKGNVEFFDSLVDRYQMMYERFLEISRKIDASVDFMGNFNTLDEIKRRSLDTVLNIYGDEDKRMKNMLSFLTVVGSEELDNIESWWKDPEDLRFKMVPSAWRTFDSLNFFSIIALSIGQAITKSGVWSEIDLFTDPFFDYEDRYDYEEDLMLSNFYRSFEKELSFLDGYGLGRRQYGENITLGCSGSLIIEISENSYKINKYPPFYNYFGNHYVPMEYRIFKGFDSFYFNYGGEKIRQMISFLKMNPRLSAEKIFTLSNFELLKERTYIISPLVVPIGYSMSTTIYGNENLYRNSNIKLNSNYSFFDAEDSNRGVFRELVEDTIELVFFFGLVGSFMTYTVYLIIEKLING